MAAVALEILGVVVVDVVLNPPLRHHVEDGRIRSYVDKDPIASRAVFRVPLSAARDVALPSLAAILALYLDRDRAKVLNVGRLDVDMRHVAAKAGGIATAP